MAIGATNKLIIAFVTLIVGAVLIGSIAETTLGVTDTTLASNESLTFTSSVQNGTLVNSSVNHSLTYAPSGWKSDGECPISDVVVYNGTAGTLTSATDYIVDLDDGIILFLDTSLVDNMIITDNVSTVTYKYCSDDYLNLSWGRTGANTAVGFFAIACLAISVGIFYSIMKDYGLLNKGV